jgi:hypothetical protein
MGFWIDYDSLHKIMRVSVEGEYTDDILREGYAAMARFHESYNPACSIVDCTRVTKVEVSHAVVQWMADVQPPVFPCDMLKVTVAPKEIMFGVSRM